MNGFSLLETVIAVALFSIISISAGSLLAYSGNAGRNINESQELLENGRISMDFIITQVRSAKGLVLFADADGDLKRLELDGFLPSVKTPHTYLFKYVKTERRLEFGGINDELATSGSNTLAVDITGVKITVDDERQILRITVVVGTNGLTLHGETSIKYKKVVVA